MKKDKLDIIYEDKSLIVVNKPSHLLTISTDNEKEKTLFHKVMLYEKRKNKNNKVFIVHRLDKDTSGIILFAKDEKIKFKLQNNWEKEAKRGYVAIVNGKTKNKETLKSYLAETKTLMVYSTDEKHGKLAITEYEKIKENKKMTLLKIKIKTGRKNQIRVQLNDNGNSIVGDKKYGDNKFDPLRRLCLHANYLEIIHPVTNKKMVFETEIPKEFLKIFDN
jgi:23S rRNA pseudouridine1911/1915/1917 synthase